MADVFEKEKRSEIMRAVKSNRNKSTELKVIKIFKKRGIVGWRRNYKLFGKPDFVFPKERIVLFADGCFWHGHNCRNLKPSSNKEYWRTKIENNKKRDKEINRLLKKSGWKVIRVWECEIEKEKFVGKIIKLKKAQINDQ
jgi:DNA mismatch endonuclease (patch repair protein)